MAECRYEKVEEQKRQTRKKQELEKRFNKDDAKDHSSSDEEEDDEDKINETQEAGMPSLPHSQSPADRMLASQKPRHMITASSADSLLSQKIFCFSDRGCCALADLFGRILQAFCIRKVGMSSQEIMSLQLEVLSF